MNTGIIIGLIAIVIIWVWPAIADKRLRHQIKKTNRKYSTDIKEANKEVLKPFTYVEDFTIEMIDSLHNLKFKIGALQKISGDYESDYRVMFHFFGFLLKLKFVHSQDNNAYEIQRRSNLWGKTVASWLPLEILALGDFVESVNQRVFYGASGYEFKPACNYHGLLSRHDGDDCFNYVYHSNIGALTGEQKEGSELSLKFLQDHMGQNEISIWLDSIYPFLESHFLSKYTDD